MQFNILRNGKRKTLTVTVSEGKEGTGAPKAVNERLEGVSVSNIDEDSPYFGKVEGIAVVNVQRGSIAWRNGLRRGDIITSVNRVPIKNLDNFLNEVNRKEGALLLRILRGNTAAFLVIK